METTYLKELLAARDGSDLGKKAQGLRWLSQHQLRIPETLALTFGGSRRIAANQEQFDPLIAEELEKWIREKKSYAVRSSANLEDGNQISFAGQFDTLINVRGLEAIQEAIREVIASSHSPTLDSYFEKVGGTRSDLEMGVLIQEMVQPTLAGVAFSKNPTTGLDEVVIEAVEGLAEALVSGGITPERWIFRWGQITSRPEGKQEHEQIIRRIALETKRIADLYGEPVDLEWAYDGHKLFWLQIRPITMLGAIPLYSNRIAREVLPGIIKPLISSINIPLVNRAWIRLFDQLLGSTDLKPEELTRMFHYRAYFNMASVGRIFELLGFPRESLEMLLGLEAKSERPSPSLRTLRHLPRILSAVGKALSYHKNSKGILASFEDSARKIQRENISGLSEQALIERITTLIEFNTEIAYYNIVLPLLMNLFNTLMKKQLERTGIDFVDFDVTSGLQELASYDPNFYLDILKETYLSHSPALQSDLRSLDFDQLQTDQRFSEFAQQLRFFIERFGHLSESGSDFSSIPWRENPDAILPMVIQHTIKDRGKEKVTWETSGLRPITRWRLKPIYKRARKLRLRREQVSSIYTSSYGWFRVLFSALAHKLKNSGLLQEQDDIYYLTWPEVQGLVAAASDKPAPENLIQQRK